MTSRGGRSSLAGSPAEAVRGLREGAAAGAPPSPSPEFESREIQRLKAQLQQLQRENAELRKTTAVASAPGAKAPHEPSPSNAEPVLLFLLGKGPDPEGWYFGDMKGWGHERLDSSRYYFSWMFPTSTGSLEDPDVPVLTPALQQAVQDDAVPLESIKEAFGQFCDFLGLKVVKGSQGLLVQKGEHFAAREACWPKVECDRNQLMFQRISRVLTCLRQTGLCRECRALLDAVSKIDTEGPHQGSSVIYWKDSAGVADPVVTKPLESACALEEHLIAFLHRQRPSADGFLITDIWEWDYSAIDNTPRFIQWVFPTDETSKYNEGAPLLTTRGIQIIRHDPLLRSSIVNSLSMWCSFLGLELTTGTDRRPLVRKGTHFETRVPRCWREICDSYNHNWLRNSRVLHCLRLAGLHEEAASLMACLEETAVNHRVGNSAKFWRQRGQAEVVVGDAPGSGVYMHTRKSTRSASKVSPSGDDRIAQTVLRKFPTTSREKEVWIDDMQAVQEGEMVSVFGWSTAQGGDEFALVESCSGLQGWIARPYLVKESLQLPELSRQLQPPSHWKLAMASAMVEGFFPEKIDLEGEAGLGGALQALLTTDLPGRLGESDWGEGRLHPEPYSRLRLVRAWRLENPERIASYSLQRRRVFRELFRLPEQSKKVAESTRFRTAADGGRLPGGLDESVNENILFHGLSPRVALSILTGGLNERFAGSSAGSYFGDGVYLSEDPAKADQYAQRDVEKYDPNSGLHARLYRDPRSVRGQMRNVFGHPGEAVFYMLICRAIIGCPLRIDDRRYDPKERPDKKGHPLSLDFPDVQAFPITSRELAQIPDAEPPVLHHSLIVEKGNAVQHFRECVVFHGERIYPEYLVAYSHAS